MNRLILPDAAMPDRPRQSRAVSRPGMTLAEMVAEALPGAPDEVLDRLRVAISAGGEVTVVPRHLWRHTRPRPHAVVIITTVPGVGAIASFLTAQFINITGIYSLGALQAVYAGTSLVVGAGLAAAGAALANSLVPALQDRRQSDAATEESYQVDGWRNRLDPGVAIPFPVGRIRMAPTFAARPFIEVIGDDQYITGLFVWGHGRLDISDLRIGDTAVEDFRDIEIETREGTEGDAAITLVREQVVEDRLNVELEPFDSAPAWQTWTTCRQADRVRLVFHWPGGAYGFTKDGDRVNIQVSVGVQARPVGTQTWTDILPASPSWFSSRETSAFFRQLEWDLPARGQYEVRVYYANNVPNARISQRLTWITAAGIRRQAPITYEGPLALTAVRVRASEVANGTLDALNGIVQRYAPTWNGSTWESALSRNPAATALAVLQSQAGAYPVEQALLHLDEWAEFHDFCDQKGLKFDRVLAGDESLGEALAAICGAGRATWLRDGDGWGVVIDRPQALVVDEISPRNASQIRWSRSYVERPDAFRATFRDETTGWEEAERIVPWPGFVGAPAVLEDVRLPGKTDPDEVWIELRRRQYEIDLRPDTFTCLQSGDVRVATRGDTVRLSCDLLDAVQASARVRAVQGRLVTLDTAIEMQEGQSYGLRWQVYDDADPVGDMTEAAVTTQPGRSAKLLLAIGAELPPVGRMVQFGLTSSLDLLCRVTRLEPAQGDGYRLTLTNDAAEIDTVTDAEVPPEWVREQGADAGTAGAPETPNMGTITGAPAPYDYSGTPAPAIRPPSRATATPATRRQSPPSTPLASP